MSYRILESQKLLLVIGVIAGMTACGVGGGGGSSGSDGADGENYPGYTDFQVERDSLDSGDLTNVTLTTYDVNADGVFLKFYFPKSLKYQSNSAQILSGDDERWDRVAPYAELSNSSGRYLVFSLSRPSDDETNRVAVNFNLRAVRADPQAFIEVDLDNDDPTIPDNQEFSASDPKFSGDDRWNIAIAGDPVSTPTPASTGTPAATETPSGD